MLDRTQPPLPLPLMYRQLTADQKMEFAANIPPEFKAVPQWCCTYLQGTRVKFPIDPTTNETLRVNDPDEWVSYEMALASVVDGFGPGFYHALGFLLTTAMGVVVIDLDNKRNDPEVQKRWDTVAAAYLAAGHYVERSSSGNGYHIFLLGTLPDNKGRRAKDVELAVNRRYIVLTGNGHGVLKPDSVGTLAELIRETDTQDYDDVPFDLTVHDKRTQEQVTQDVVTQVNTSEAVRYALTKGVPASDDYSALDAELAEALFFRTMDVEMVRSILASSPYMQGGRREAKTKKRGGSAKQFDIYLERTMQYSYTQVVRRKQGQAQTVAEMQASIAAAQQRKDAPDTTPTQQCACPIPGADTGPLYQLYHVGLYVPQRHFPEAASLSAYVHTGGILSPFFVSPSGLGLNIFGNLVANSGNGKNGPISKIRQVIRLGAKDYPEFADIIDTSFSSRQALAQHLTQQQSVVIWQREYGKRFRAAFGGRNANVYQADLINFMTELYTSSSLGEVSDRYKTADRSTSYEMTLRPCVSVIGDLVADDVIAIQEVYWTDGTAARMIYVYYSLTKKPPRNRNSMADKAYLTDYAGRYLAQTFRTLREYEITQNGQVTILEQTPEAADRMEELFDLFDDWHEMSIERGDKIMAALINRFGENVQKIASIEAVSRWLANPTQSPVVQAQDYDKGLAFVLHSGNSVSGFLKLGLVGGSSLNKQQEYLLDRIDNHWNKTGSPRDTEKDFAPYARPGNEDLVPWGYLSKYVRNGQLFPTDYALKGAIDSLVNSGHLVPVFERNGRKFRGKVWSRTDPSLGV